MVQPTDASKSSFRGVRPDYIYWCNCAFWDPAKRWPEGKIPGG
jgi:hypothetical protein